MATVSDQALHEAFTASKRRHILMDTHGIHQWEVIPGLPDTGGQNVFVNQFTETLAQLGYRVTIANRGGYPHPTTGEMRTGIDYKDEHQRIVYMEDDTKEFVRKEDMFSQTPQLARYLFDTLDAENDGIDLIISHYWDGADIGIRLNAMLAKPVQHVWVPHSLGTVKKRNMPPESYAKLRIDERIAKEREMVPQLDGAAATSSVIRSALINDYGADDPLFLPPCVQADRFHPRKVPDDHAVWEFIAGFNPKIDAERVRGCRLITEVSRTDKTKRKDVLIKAFARLADDHPDAMLLTTVDRNEPELADELDRLVADNGLGERVVFLGNVWEMLPWIYAATYCYCSPSVMEGFGMAVQEAAATSVPVIGSTLIPFVCEYLLGEEVSTASYAGQTDRPLQVGAGAIVVEADDVAGFAAALERLFADPAARDAMGAQALDITIPYFTWKAMAERFFAAIGF